MRLKQERNQIIRNEEKGRLRNHCLCLGPRARDRVLSSPTRVPKLLTAAFPSGFVRHPSVGVHLRKASVCSVHA